MPISFPAALWACIAEGRAPSPRECAAITAKVRREAFQRVRGSESRLARTIAEAALAGSR